jgi:hypothetical protein
MMCLKVSMVHHLLSQNFDSPSTLAIAFMGRMSTQFVGITAAVSRHGSVNLSSQHCERQDWYGLQLEYSFGVTFKL